MIVAVLTGCGGSGVDENKPIEQITAEAAEMGKAELRNVVNQYEGLITEKRDELKKLEAQIKELPISELMGKKAKKIKAQTKDLTTSMSKLKDQLAVYARQLSSTAE